MEWMKIIQSIDLAHVQQSLYLDCKHRAGDLLPQFHACSDCARASLRLKCSTRARATRAYWPTSGGSPIDPNLQEDDMFNTISARIGAACYVLWGLLHYGVAYNVYQSALGLPPSMAQGRLFQNAFYLFSFATAGIVIAVSLNWHNSRAGFWANALLVGVADVPFILFVLVPGYLPLLFGSLGPDLWVAGMLFTGLGQASRGAVTRATA
jgi:hypothetical protein